MSAHIEWLAARETSVQVFTPGEDWAVSYTHLTLPTNREV